MIAEAKPMIEEAKPMIGRRDLPLKALATHKENAEKIMNSIELGNNTDVPELGQIIADLHANLTVPTNDTNPDVIYLRGLITRISLLNLRAQIERARMSVEEASVTLKNTQPEHNDGARAALQMQTSLLTALVSAAQEKLDYELEPNDPVSLALKEAENLLAPKQPLPEQVADPDGAVVQVADPTGAAAQTADTEEANPLPDQVADPDGAVVQVADPNGAAAQPADTEEANPLPDQVADPNGAAAQPADTEEANPLPEEANPLPGQDPQEEVDGGGGRYKSRRRRKKHNSRKTHKKKNRKTHKKKNRKTRKTHKKKHKKIYKTRKM